MAGAWRNSAWDPPLLDVTVFGRHGDRYYGIPLIMDILEEHGWSIFFESAAMTLNCTCIRCSGFTVIFAPAGLAVSAISCFNSLPGNSRS